MLASSQSPSIGKVKKTIKPKPASSDTEATEPCKQDRTILNRTRLGGLAGLFVNVPHLGTGTQRLATHMEDSTNINFNSEDTIYSHIYTESEAESEAEAKAEAEAKTEAVAAFLASAATIADASDLDMMMTRTPEKASVGDYYPNSVSSGGKIIGTPTFNRSQLLQLSALEGKIRDYSLLFQAGSTNSPFINSQSTLAKRSSSIHSSFHNSHGLVSNLETPRSRSISSSDQAGICRDSTGIQRISSNNSGRTATFQFFKNL
jgi:hypothetical protein